jgi:hypothetical protein
VHELDRPPAALVLRADDVVLQEHVRRAGEAWPRAVRSLSRGPVYSIRDYQYETNMGGERGGTKMASPPVAGGAGDERHQLGVVHGLDGRLVLEVSHGGGVPGVITQ